MAFRDAFPGFDDDDASTGARTEVEGASWAQVSVDVWDVQPGALASTLRLREVVRYTPDETLADVLDSARAQVESLYLEIFPEVIRSRVVSVVRKLRFLT